MQQLKQRKAQMIQVTADAIKEMKIFAHSVAMRGLQRVDQEPRLSGHASGIAKASVKVNALCIVLWRNTFLNGYITNTYRNSSTGSLTGR